MTVIKHLVFPRFEHSAPKSKSTTVELNFKNRQDKNQLCFKSQIKNDQIGQISFKNRQDKNNLTLRTKMAVTKNVLKVKFDCTLRDGIANCGPSKS